MSSQPVTTREPVTAEVTDVQVAQLIKEREAAGATCTVEKQGNQRTIVCRWPRLEGG
jgi:hypothetical protein